MKEIEQRIAQINNGDAEQWEGEKDDLIKEQKQLYKYEKDFPHIFIENEDHESVVRYFRDELEKAAFVKAYVAIRAQRQAEAVISKRWRAGKAARADAGRARSREGG